jgi:hypothetical protein
MDRAVARGLERRETTHIPHLGIDEKSFRKGHDHITVLQTLTGDQVRRAENKALQAEDDDRLKGMLSKTSGR